MKNVQERISDSMNEFKMSVEQWERFFIWLQNQTYDVETHGAIWWWLTDKMYAWKLKIALEGITRKVK